MSAIRVYVGGIPKSAGNREIEEAFQRFGKIVNVWIARNPPGFAFVDFEDPRDADDAIKDMDGKELLGERIRVQMARGGVRRGGRDDRDRSYRDGSSDRHRSSGHKVRITGLPRNADWRDVKDFVRKAGDVSFCDMDGDDAIVELASKFDLENVIRKLDDTEFDGRRVSIKAVRDRSQSPRRRASSRSRTPPRRRSSRPPPPRKKSD
ncbi:hypothetical protein LEN26_006576 [Aphanomyces euteiches]|nr:hypothetical protein AeMF1_007948 [Aphanomyces euteiches]KAH9135096.1 hypothetical protein LEN26_006576 [Aphanomyces euteiches]KAH9190478.1 hypothetical protein AeNC1_007535 [Aphanomyces euteiches]